MQTIGFVGVGKIGMPISENLIKSGYRVVMSAMRGVSAAPSAKWRGRV